VNWVLDETFADLTPWLSCACRRQRTPLPGLAGEIRHALDAIHEQAWSSWAWANSGRELNMSSDIDITSLPQPG
jgi:hypothetical protein